MIVAGRRATERRAHSSSFLNTRSSMGENALGENCRRIEYFWYLGRYSGIPGRRPFMT